MQRIPSSASKRVSVDIVTGKQLVTVYFDPLKVSRPAETTYTLKHSHHLTIIPHIFSHNRPWTSPSRRMSGWARTFTSPQVFTAPIFALTPLTPLNHLIHLTPSLLPLSSPIHTTLTLFTPHTLTSLSALPPPLRRAPLRQEDRNPYRQDPQRRGVQDPRGRLHRALSPGRYRRGRHPATPRVQREEHDSHPALPLQVRSPIPC